MHFMIVIITYLQSSPCLSPTTKTMLILRFVPVDKAWTNKSDIVFFLSLLLLCGSSFGKKNKTNKQTTHTTQTHRVFRTLEAYALSLVHHNCKSQRISQAKVGCIRQQKYHDQFSPAIGHHDPRNDKAMIHNYTYVVTPGRARGRVGGGGGVVQVTGH